MNTISNIWQHPRTSVAGVLIAAVTIAGVLAGQGVTLGNIGNGTVITLVAALATALLGLLAKDPGSASSTVGSTQRLGVLAMIALLVTMPWMATGCSGVSVAQDIVNWTPALQSAVATVDSTAALLDPAAAPIFAAATVGFDAGSNLLAGQAKAYLANPGAGLLATLRSQAVTFQQDVNAAVLAAAKITNPSSQQHALNAIGVVVTIVNAILALVASISSKAAVAQMAADSTVKLAQIEPLLDRRTVLQVVTDHYAGRTFEAAVRLDAGEYLLTQQGF